MHKPTALALAALMAGLIAGTPVFKAEAGRLGGFGRIFDGPRHIVPKILPHRALRRSLGAVAVAVVGVAILNGLSSSQRAEVARRTKRAVESDPDEEVVDTYTTKKGDKTVKITASPAQPASSFRDDPALQVASNESSQGPGSAPNPQRADAPQGGGTEDSVVADSGDTGDGPPGPVAKSDSPPSSGNKKQASKDKDDKDGIKLAELPDDTSCRKVTTELTVAANAKTGEAEKTESNAAILCKTADGKWQPALS